jgi:F-type H+-transporting ATPase subunit gamma
MQLLPIPKLEGAGAPEAPIDYIFEPSRGDILDALLPTHLNTQMWNVLLESNAAEQGARMTAMENATRNAKDLVRELRRSYNKARQTAITTEILEIVSGAEALKNQ